MQFFENFLVTVKGILLSPNRFFEEITWDSGWKESIVFFAICLGIFALALSIGFTWIFNATFLQEPAVLAALKEMGFPYRHVFLMYLVFFFGSGMIGSQLISFATTIALHLLGGTGSMQRTFTALSCCWSVLLFEWIPLVGWLGGLYFFYLAYVALAKAHNVPGWKGLASLFLGTGAIWLLFAAIIFVAGLSSVHPYAYGPDPREIHDPATRALIERYRAHSEGSENSENTHSEGK